MSDNPWDNPPTAAATPSSAATTQDVTAKSLLWEQKVLEKAVLAAVTEQRRSRRWGIFFKLLFLIAFAGVVLSLLPSDWTKGMETTESHVAVIHVYGVIESSRDASAENIIESMKAAFEEKQVKGIILDINSPGGSAVQSSQVYDAIQDFRQTYPDKAIYAVFSDMGTSGAYFMAAATNEIYANPASIVGSIGVLMDGFGFVDTLKKVGVERRLLTAGAHKGFLDPYSPVKPDEQAFTQVMLEDVHQQFIDKVKQGRGERLKSTEPLLFTGYAWSGQQALPLGLIDGFGSVREVAQDKFKTDNLVDYSYQPDFIAQLSGRFGTQFGHGFAAYLLDNAKPLTIQ